jgi:hypothetical protein
MDGYGRTEQDEHHMHVFHLSYLHRVNGGIINDQWDIDRSPHAYTHNANHRCNRVDVSLLTTAWSHTCF